MFSIRPGILIVAAAAMVACARADVAGLRERLEEIGRERRALPEVVASPQSPQRLGFHGFEADPAWLVIDFGHTVTPEKLAIFPARLPGMERDAPSGFPGELEIEIGDDPDFSASIEIAEWREAYPGAGEMLPFLMFEGNRASGRYLRVLVRGLREDPRSHGRKYFRLGEIVVLENGQNVARDCPVTSTETFISPRAWEDSNVTDGYFWCEPLRGAATSPTEGYRTETLREPLASGSVWAEIDLGVRRPIEEIRIVPAQPKSLAYLGGYGFPTHFVVLADPGTEDEKLLLKENSPPFPGEALPNPGTSPLLLATPGLEARRIRLVCEALWRSGPGSGKGPSEYVFALGEVQCWYRGKNFAEGAVVNVSGKPGGGEWSAAALADGYSSTHELLSWRDWLDGIERSEALREEEASIRVEITRAGEVSARARGRLAMAAAGATMLAAAAVLVLQRARARRKEEALRERIARDLHDEIGASLSHLAMQGDLARQQLLRDELTTERLEGISTSARETLDQMRDIIWLLAPREGGDWTEFSQRLEAIANRLLEGVRHRVEVTGEPPPGQPPIAWARDIVAFLKESLTNARRHGDADEVRVSIGWGATLLLTIEDDGVGFDPKDTRAGAGIGLENLRQRAASLQAECQIRSGPGEGTRIQLTAPLRAR